MMLNTKNQVVGLHRACGKSECKNRPSGDPTPNREDIDLTKRLAERANTRH
ncbi:JAB domain-containing protein [Peribacillus simplex]|uniref:JAB domain-containing protein n=1 Tax=Peribacillus simplex TaxID=1478 RepID=UPI003B8DD4FC